MDGESVIVIGAGMAGIAAARTLHDAGRRVKIVEARDRLGGRTYTDTSLGIANDLGASWIHGPIGNPLTPLAKRFGVTTAYTDFDNCFANSVVAFDAGGHRLDSAEYTFGLRQFGGVYDHLFTSILYEQPGEAVRSMADLYAFGLPVPEELGETARQGFYYASVVRVQYGEAADLDEIDWRLANRYVKLPGGDLLLPGGGYTRIVDGLSEGLSVETGVVVERIIYGDDGVVLQTNRGEDRCSRAVVTLPLGVLKAGAIEFVPALPPDKQAAIARLGYGHYEKLALRFPHRFWPEEPHRFNYLPGVTPELFTSWLNMAHYTGEPVLVAHHAGSRARHINHLRDDDLIAQAMAVLRKLFGPSAPAPERYVRTGWETDRFSLGSYSFAKVGSQPGDRQALAAPVCDRLFFAGEATHPRYFATVHGAYETGVRAAREIERLAGVETGSEG